VRGLQQGPPSSSRPRRRILRECGRHRLRSAKAIQILRVTSGIAGIRDQSYGTRIGEVLYLGRWLTGGQGFPRFVDCDCQKGEKRFGEKTSSPHVALRGRDRPVRARATCWIATEAASYRNDPRSRISLFRHLHRRWPSPPPLSPPEPAGA